MIDDATLAALADRLFALMVDRFGLAAPGARPPPSGKLLTKSELAAHLRRSPSTIDRWAEQGMPFEDMGTYRLYDGSACARWVGQRPRPGRRPRSSGGHTTSTRLPGQVELRTRGGRAA